MAEYYDFKIDQGATWRVVLGLTDENDDPINLTGFTARMQIKRFKHQEISAQTLTTENDAIEISTPLTGDITLQLTNVQTEALAGIFYYDLEIVSSGAEVTRILEGRVIMNEEVTRYGD